MNIFLYGPSGSGKSSAGRLLSEKIGQHWIDLDAEIEKETGQTVETLFSILGEPGFRDLESTLLDRIVREQPQAVISLGGGALLRESNQRMAETHGKILLLIADVDTLVERLENDPYIRPLVKENPRQRITELLERRKQHYTSFGTPIDTTGRSPAKVVHEIQVRLGIFSVNGMGNPYDVIVRTGALDFLGDYLLENGLRGPLALVCDGNVEDLYAERALVALKKHNFETSLVVIPPGEQHKTIDTVKVIWEGFLRAGVERGSVVIALGGGVTGDLTGFAAATYLRGVRWVNVSTTLLAMVDSSLGGKTGADLPSGKNLIGAFHAPSLALNDPETLATLPQPELRNGLAELFKHGVISDPILYEACRQGWPQSPDEVNALISRSIAVKVCVVNTDPFERDMRQGLNFGHTVGHGIEKASDYRLSHGESVAIGMVIETHLSEAIGLAPQGLAEDICDILARLGLPVAIPSGISLTSIFEAMLLDKKRSNKQLLFALPERIGAVRTGVVIDNWQERIQSMLEGKQ